MITSEDVLPLVKRLEKLWNDFEDFYADVVEQERSTRRKAREEQEQEKAVDTVKLISWKKAVIKDLTQARHFDSNAKTKSRNMRIQATYVGPTRNGGADVYRRPLGNTWCCPHEGMGTTVLSKAEINLVAHMAVGKFEADLVYINDKLGLPPKHGDPNIEEYYDQETLFEPRKQSRRRKTPR